MAERFSLKDHLFNAQTLGRLADEFAAGLPGFDRDGFLETCVPGLQGRELLERLEWMADCLEPHLATDFPKMADQLEAAMPPILDPTLKDDDFGHFIHAVPGILAVRHGMEAHRDRALDLLEAATQRFSMEFYIRAFLNRWPDETLTRLRAWVTHPNYHVRRLVSEGTRPRLPWARNIDIDPMVPLEFLEQLHGDTARFVTRSVANHMNDLSRVDPARVMDVLESWRREGRQDPIELAWMTSHALRTLIKAGDGRAMAILGYAADAEVTVETLEISPAALRIGDKAEVRFTLSADVETPVLVDYAIRFTRTSGGQADKVFKVKQAVLKPGKAMAFKKAQVFKADATTFTLVPGPHRLSLMINGVVRATLDFDLGAAE